MATVKQERKEREAARAFWLSVINTAIVLGTFVFGVCWSIHQKTSFDKQLGNVETSLRLLTATVAPRLQQAIDDSLKAALNDSTMQPEQASRVLAKVETDTANLRKLKATLPPQQVNQTSATLEKVVNQHPDTVSAWGAAAEMVSYRSELRGVPLERPDCFRTQEPEKPTIAGPMIYHDCTLNLDDIAGLKAVAPWLYQYAGPGGTLTAYGQVEPVIVLQNGTVKYSGGPMISIERLICENCSFMLRSPETIPPAPGRALATQLLIADLDNVALNLPKPS